MTSPLRRYISAFPRCTVTDSSCIAQRTNAPLGKRRVSAAMSPRWFKNFRLLAHVFARLKREQHQPECGMIRHTLPEPRPLSQPSPQSTQLSWQAKQRTTSQTHAQPRHVLQQARASAAPPRCRPGAGICRQIRPGTRHLPGHRKRKCKCK